MKNNKMIAVFFCILVILFSAACSSQKSKYEIPDDWESTTKLIITENTDKSLAIEDKTEINLDAMSMYAGFKSYGEAINESELIVFGTVKEVGNSYQCVFETEYYPGKYSRPIFYYTPITIEIEEIIKGNHSSRTVVYNALGGIYNGTVYKSDAYGTLDYAVGDKILVYLDKNYDELGYECIGPQCIIGEGENGLSNKADIGGTLIVSTLEEQVEATRNAYKYIMEKDSKTE